MIAGKYRVERVLGRGGMGTVVAASHVGLGQSFAIKLMLPDLAASAEFSARFIREARAAASIRGEHVVRVFDVAATADGTLYMVMELLEGDDLSDVLKARGSLPIEEAAYYMLQACDALAEAHAQGIVHRDLKPGNLFLARRGAGASILKVLDFGISKSSKLDAAQGGPTLTAPEAMLGSPYYMSPEQLRSSKSVDARSDIWSLGLILHKLITGFPAFESESLGEHLAMLAADPPARLRLRRPDAPEGLEAVVLRCLEKDATRRFQDVGQLAAALAPFARRSPELSSPSERRCAEHAIAVLPLRYLGDAEHAYLGDVIADELVDALARTRGLKVFGTGATAAHRETRDPRAIGRDLRVDAVIDGMMRREGGRTRITIRLLDARSGAQLWSQRQDDSLSRLSSFEESIARRVAEQLRIELSIQASQDDAPTEAVELYLAARRQLRAHDYPSMVAAAAELDRCVALAPGFRPALAAHAMACMRASILDAGGALDWQEAANRSVSRALLIAPDLPESHLAAAMAAIPRLDFGVAAHALRQALALAPTYAEANEYLGMLQCETGPSARGVERLLLADALDPTLVYPLAFIGRDHALHGRFAEADEALDELERRRGQPVFVATVLRARFAAWRRDDGALRGLAERLREQADKNFARVMHLYASALLGEVSAGEIEAEFSAKLAAPRNPRYAAVAMQLLVEVTSAAGRCDEAILHLMGPASEAFIDVAWLDHCPLLAPLRARREHVEARRRAALRGRALAEIG